MEKYGNIEKKLKDKASVDMTKHLDKRMQQMEDRLTQIDRELASKFQPRASYRLVRMRLGRIMEYLTRAN